MGVLQNLGYENVTLQDSHWKAQREELIETYLSIDSGEYLHYFRELAGIPDHYDGLVGWYGNNASTFGQKIGAMARLYKVTKDARLYDKAMELVKGWGECAKKSDVVIDINGTYVFDKLITGFLDIYEYLHFETALEYVHRLTESAARRFRREIPRDGFQDETMGADMIEWYTLPEQLYRAYSFTGDRLYLDFAREWDYPYFWDRLAAGDYRIGPRHAYSHVNSLSSAAMAYLVTGEEHYMDAVRNGYEEILRHHTFATGGYGPAECLFSTEEGYLGDSLKANWDRDRIHKQYLNFSRTVVDRDDMWGSCEVSCCSWAVFKLCNYLLTITGEARYGVWAEKLLYNGCGGQLPITKDGKVMYYADYFINGGMKSVTDGRLQDDGSSFEWQCCTGTFPEDVAEYSNMLYYLGEDGLYVSQYLASTVDFRIGETLYCLENDSFYPKERELRFVVHVKNTDGKTANGMEDTPQSFGLHFRVPSWAGDQSVVCVNGERMEACAVKPDTWLTIKRSWKEGDRVTITYEFTLRFEVVDAHSPDVAALCYGPVVLVCDKMTLFTGDIEHPEEWIEPMQKDGYSFSFRTKPGHVIPYGHLTREFYPYYEVPEHEWYYMYNRIRIDYKKA